MQTSQQSDSIVTDDKLTMPLNQQDEQIIYPKPRSFFQRAFSPMGQGAMRGSIFALLASAMGTGVFNLPYRVNAVGVIPFILMFLAAGFFSYLGMYLMSRLILRFDMKSYSDMTERAYGNTFKRVAQFCLIIYPWGITVCFQVIFAKFVMQLLYELGGINVYIDRSKDKYNTQGAWIRFGVIIGLILFNLIFILKKQIGILQKLSIVSVLSVVINSSIILVTLFAGFETKPASQQQKVYIYNGLFHLDWSKIKLFNTDGAGAISTYLQTMASFIFCYVNHQLVFPLQQDLNNPIKRRLDKIFFRVHVSQIIIYFVVGMCGYLLLVEHIEQRPINSLVIANIQTIAMAIGKILMLMALFVSIPLNMFPARQVFYECFKIQLTDRNHIRVSLAMTFSGTLIAIFFSSVNSYFGLLGGTAGVMMAGGIPAICYYKVKGLRTNNQKAIVIYIGIISVMAAAGAILSVVNAD